MPLAPHIILSNVGTSLLLKADETVGDFFETISGQFTWVVNGIPRDASMYFEQRFKDADGVPVWLPLYEFASCDQIEKGELLSGSLQLEIPDRLLPRHGNRGRGPQLGEPQRDAVPIGA